MTRRIIHIDLDAVLAAMGKTVAGGIPVAGDYPIDQFREQAQDTNCFRAHTQYPQQFFKVARLAFVGA